MKRVLVGTMAALVVLASVASAQAPYTANFRFSTTGSQYDQYTGSFDGGSTTFQVFCVNPNQYVNVGETFTNAWVTPLSSGDGSRVVNANSSWSAGYLAAARIASLANGYPATGSYAFIGAGITVTDLQYAIWNVMGFGYSSANVTTVRNYATANVPAPVPSDWLVITDANKARQEFITQSPGGPQEIVPEPATMTLLATGLAGMAAASRRRKQK